MKWASENKYDAYIGAAIARNGNVAPLSVVKAIIGAESGYNPNAYRAEPHISDASRGLMQVLFRTAQGVGFKGSASDLFDPETNINVGVKFLSDLIKSRGGDVWAAVSAYNNGNGKRANGTTTVCLARNADGSCATSFVAHAGDFYNQPYVDKVQTYATYFGGMDTSPASVGVGFVILLALGVWYAYRNRK